MIWLDITTLETKLQQRIITDREVFHYLLGCLITMSLLAGLPGTLYQNTWLSQIDIVLTLIIIVVGTKRLYDINARGDNADYFRRFIALSFVSGMRLLLVLIIVAFPVALFRSFTHDPLGLTQDVKELAGFFIGMLFISAYYFSLLRSFKRVSAINNGAVGTENQLNQI